MMTTTRTTSSLAESTVPEVVAFIRDAHAEHARRRAEWRAAADELHRAEWAHIDAVIHGTDEQAAAADAARREASTKELQAFHYLLYTAELFGAVLQ